MVHWRRTSGLLALLCAIGCLTSGAAGIRRYNPFDPLFADDDSDTHTVSAGPTKAPDSTNSSGRRVLEISNANARSSGQRLPSVLDDDDDTGLPHSTGRRASPAQLTSSTTAHAPLGAATSRLESAISATAPSTSFKRHLSSQLQDKVDQQASSKSPGERAQRQTDKPEHWSALTSYYEKLRKAQRLPSESLPSVPYLNQDPDFYPLDQKLIDEWARKRRPPPTYSGQAAKTAPEFGARLTPAQSAGPLGQDQVGGPNSAWSFSSLGSTELQGHHTRPAYSPEQIVLSNVPVRPAPSVLPTSSHQQQQEVAFQRPIDVPMVAMVPIRPYSPAQQQQQQQQPRPMPHQFDQQVVQQPIDIPWPLGEVRAVGREQQSAQQWKQLAELLYQQQQDARVKHQLETFGPVLDQRRFQEQVRQESYCGPRNRILGLELSRLGEQQLNAARLSQLLNAAAPGEYPSHMGLYNGTSPADDQYLCAATWVHERFALTLASCIPRKLAPNKDPMLTIRAGEWAVLRPGSLMNAANATSSGDQRARPPATFTRRIKDVHTFPRYQANSSEHNLALVEWLEPTDYLTNYSFISPACPMQARPTSGQSSCWAPVRNISFSEYFDAEGEGETKLRKSVGMQEVPIKLLADDADCRRETQADLFNFQHPNYICSADVRRASWRVKLNQTDNFGSGIYCNEAGRLSLVSILHPIQLNAPSQLGYLDLTYYRPWMQGVIWGRSNLL